MRYNKKTLLLSAVTLGLLTTQVEPLLVNASANTTPKSEVVTENISKENGKTYHIVRGGETVYSISNKYKISQDALRVWNNLSGNTIQVNQVLSVDGVNVYNNLTKETNRFSSTQQFINQVAPIALEMAEKYQLYPSVMIAQAVLETGSGTSELAEFANNYYGIKGTYKGNSVYKLSPEEVKGTIIQQSSRFRVYPSLRASVEDNGKRLRLGPNTDSEAKPWSALHYKGTWVENTKSHYDATKALLDAGYATDSKYPDKLNKIIADYNLSDYDKKIYDHIDDSITGPVKPGSSDVAADPKPEEKPKPEVKPTPQPEPEKGQETVTSDKFLEVARALPSVAAIEKMDLNQLSNLQKTFASVQASYNSLTKRQKDDTMVKRWIGYVVAKEEAVKAAQAKLQAMSSDAFIEGVKALPNVSDIEAMNRPALDELDQEMNKLRAGFNAMSKQDKAEAMVARWVTFLTVKEDAVLTRAKALAGSDVASSKENAERFVSTVMEMPDLTRISQMNRAEASKLEEEMKGARALYKGLSTTEQADKKVNQWEGYLTSKEKGVADRLQALPSKEADDFVVGVKAMANISQINRMNETTLKGLQADIEAAQGLYNRLSAKDKADSKVKLELSSLEQKELAVEDIFTAAHDFEALIRKTPNVATVKLQTPAELEQTLKQYEAGRKAYNALPAGVKTFANVIRWEDYLTTRENTALGGTASVVLSKEIKYSVESGDTFNTIAEKFQVDLNALLRRNSKFDPAKLKSGDTLFIPNGVARPMDHAQATDNQHVIYLDAGHGGSDPGTRGGGTTEKVLNLNLARKLTSRLEGMGYTVINSRTNDREISLTDRARDVNATNADIFISLHHNAFNGSANGIETFYYKYAAGYPSHLNKTYHNDGARIANSVYLSHLIQDNLISETKATYRRVDGTSFAVLRETNIPATLVEFGFMDNRQEVSKLVDDAYQNKMVKAVADAVDTYFKTLYN